MTFDTYNFANNYRNNSNSQIFTNKDRIYQYIKNNPGTHLRKIKKELGLAMGDIQYNLNVLERLELIKYRRLGIYKHYYAKSILGSRNELILAILQQETPRAIILCLIEFPGLSQKEMAHNLRFSIPTIKWHILKLIEINLIRIHNEGRTTKYYVNGDIMDFIILMKSYHPSLVTRLSSRLVDIFIELSSATVLDHDNNNDSNSPLYTKDHERDDLKIFRQVKDEDEKT